MALPFLADELAREAVLTHWDTHVAAARGLVDAGSRDVAADVMAITKLMREEGVEQYGEKTALVWGQEEGKRTISVTTALHESQEQEFIRTCAGSGGRPKCGAAGEVASPRRSTQSGLDFSGRAWHGAARSDRTPRPWRPVRAGDRRSGRRKDHGVEASRGRMA